jgi:hypothetical protein
MTGEPPPTGPGQPPPEWGQPPAWGQPPQYGYGQQPYGYPAPGYTPPPYYQSPQYQEWLARSQEPDNGAALGGFITSLTSIGVLVFFIGLSAPLTLIASGVAIFVSREGLRKVERGETSKGQDQAQWGFWVGVAGVVLSLISIVLWA